MTTQTNPPMLPGTAPIAQSAVSPAMTAWAVAVLKDPAHYPMGSWDLRMFNGKEYVARVEWHNEIGRTGQVLPPGSYIRGITLYQVTNASLLPAKPPVVPDAPPVGDGTIHGIDVSHWQGNIDWVKVAASGIRFAFIKATDGLNGVDPSFAKNWAGAKAAGIARGAYHYLHPNLAGASQADLFLHTVTVGGMHDLGELSPAIDLEESDGADPNSISVTIELFMQHMYEFAPGEKVALYTAPGWWLQHSFVFSQPAPAGSYLWIAHWDVADPGTITGWDKATVWQYSARGAVPGITGTVDLDRFLGDEAAFAAWKRGADAPPSTQPGT
jgi:GH25 family lysozyme M1 (1,4-beta-N-acetylmuramidase)